ncbi:hypothetical protein M513_05393 [Trichuris suis]|uniref:Uncharacterized protein n=1 Tax=Trichuris suis TaxID=68888 RepID=A0A085M8Z2_9BILA|nr:hypothetical protein M513_05393 [Trichuris suis]
MKSYHKIWFESGDKAKNVKLDDVKIDVPPDVAEEDKLERIKEEPVTNDQLENPAARDACRNCTYPLTRRPTAKIVQKDRSSHVLTATVSESANGTTNQTAVRLSRFAVFAAPNRSEAFENVRYVPAIYPKSTQRQEFNFAATFDPSVNASKVREEIQATTEALDELGSQPPLDQLQIPLPVSANNHLVERTEDKRSFTRANYTSFQMQSGESLFSSGSQK